MDAGAVPDSFDKLLSTARFSRYLKRYGGNRTYALRLYAWNLEASSALWGPINILEIAVRNAIHDKLVERTSRGDWWSDTHL